MPLRFLALLLIAATSAPGPGQGPIPAPFGEVLEQLQEQSSWAQDTTLDGPPPRGAYPVGNGRVFAHLGLGRNANTLRGVTGPRYHDERESAPDGHFGEVGLDVLVGGETATLPRQRLRRVRGSAIVVTEDAADGGLALRTLTFARPDAPALTRIIELHNRGDREISDLTLRLAVPDSEIEASTHLTKGSAGGQPYKARYWITGARVNGDTLATAIGDLAAGERWRGVMTISTHAADAPASDRTPRPDTESALEDVRTTMLWWKDKLAATLSFDTDHRKLRDLVEDWKVSMLTQRCAETGAVIAMLHDRRADIRQSIGAMLGFLRLGLWEEAGDLLRFVHGATRRMGRVADRARLDLDLSGLPPTQWARIDVGRGDIPSWIVLLHHWYWRTTRDTALIRAHRGLLELCVKRQKRSEDDLLEFHGGEAFLRQLHPLLDDRITPPSLLIAEDAQTGRRSHSFASGVLFILALQAWGELLDALDRDANPDRWSGEGPENRPSAPWIRRSIELMHRVEKRYWLDAEQIFAPALSQLTGRPHRWPVAEANLLPLWVGWTFPTGERSRANLTGTLARLWHRDARIGSTATLGYATGAAQGMLVSALAERDGKELLDAFDALLAMAEPAGEWAALYGPDGSPTGSTDPARADRLQPFDSGVNLDALLYAVTGMRQATIPNWDNTDVRAKLRLPHGAHYVTIRRARKDTRELNLFLREVHRKLDKEEREANERAAPQARRDATQVHRRLHFRIELASETPAKGYVDAAITVMNTVFVRYLQGAQPIDEIEFWKEPDAALFPSRTGPAPVTLTAPPPQAGAELLVLTNRNAGKEMYGSPRAQILDTGLPIDPAAVDSLLFDGEDNRFPVLLLDWGYDDGGPRSGKTARLWRSPNWHRSLTAFGERGGRVVTPGYATRWTVAAGDDQGRELEALNGRLSLGPGTPTVVRTTFTVARAREAVLRIGSGCSIKARWNGAAALDHTGPRQPLPDSDAVVVRVRAGANTLEVEVGNDGSAVLFARLTDSAGLPLTP